MTIQQLKNVIRNSKLLQFITCGAAVVPTSPGRVMVDEHAQGLQLLYTADNPAEAGWLQQVLADAGFHMEHVPSTTAGLFGIVGGNSIYVRPEEYDDASDFLSEYLQPAQDSPALPDEAID